MNENPKNSNPRPTEAALAAAYGISRDLLQKFRNQTLQKGVDWSLDKRTVKYHPAGLLLISQEFGETPDLEKKIEKGPGAAPRQPSRLKVLNVPRNRRIVLACQLNRKDKAAAKLKEPKELRVIAPDDLKAAALRVRVRDNSKFVIGMEMEVRHIDGDLFELAGNQPRYIGRF